MAPSIRSLLAAIPYPAESLPLAGICVTVWFADYYRTSGAMNRPAPLIAYGPPAMFLPGEIPAHLYPCWYRGGAPLFLASFLASGLA